MTLAAVAGFCLLSLGWATALQPQGSASTSQAQAPQSQSSQPAQVAPAPASQPPSSSGQTKPSPQKPRHRKKTGPPNCSDAPTPLSPAVGNSADSTKAAGTPSIGPAPKAGSPALPPCPPPKKVVRNGGSDEPAIQLTGGTTDEQAAHQNSTNQLTAATDENLKKLAGRQLTPSQQDSVNQIKEFLEQSKSAVFAGDLERGQNLAQKAHLLSEELVKP